MNALDADDGMAAVLAACIAADDAMVAAAPQPDTALRMPWPEGWFQQTDAFDMTACQRMWGAVLLSCLRGALGVSSAYETEIAGAVPADWIGSPDFVSVCDYAGVDPVGLLACLADPPRRAALMETLRLGSGASSSD